MGNRSSFPLACRLNNLSQRPPWPGPDAGRHRDQRHLTWHPLVLRSHCAGGRDVAAVKPEAQQGSPKEQNRYDHVIGFRQPRPQGRCFQEQPQGAASRSKSPPILRR
jgi:hypothetical protein